MKIFQNYFTILREKNLVHELKDSKNEGKAGAEIFSKVLFGKALAFWNGNKLTNVKTNENFMIFFLLQCNEKTKPCRESVKLFKNCFYWNKNVCLHEKFFFFSFRSFFKIIHVDLGVKGKESKKIDKYIHKWKKDKK